MNDRKMKQLSFSNIRFKDLKAIVPVEQSADEIVFKEWFDFEFPFSEEKVTFLSNLIHGNRLKINAYTKAERRAKFLIPLLGKADFVAGEISDWYERSIKGKMNGVEVGGVTDFMVAKGVKKPEIPYFYIREFKPSKPSVLLEDQLLAELMVSIELIETKLMKGAYIVGQFWTFVLLQKQLNDSFILHLVPSLDALKLDDLKQIYKHLKAVKAEILAKVSSTES
ncbi:MAG: hypothetical protein AAGG68_30960 [Bacteroidota bacterium]